MLIIDRAADPVSPDDLLAKEIDKLVLTREQRRWVRGHFTTAKGRDVALALPTGTMLEPGVILWVEPLWYLIVEAAAEPVLAIFPSDYQNALKVAFEVGNRHFPLALEEDRLLVQDDPAMVQLLERLGASWERRQSVFNPIGNAHRHEHS
ncbi:MAG: urease accessory protein UreE [Terriglobia bacterium]